MDGLGGLSDVVRRGLEMCDKSVDWEYRVEWVVLLDTGMVKQGMVSRWVLNGCDDTIGSQRVSLHAFGLSLSIVEVAVIMSLSSWH